MTRKPDLYDPIHRAIDGARYSEALSLARELGRRFPNDETTALNNATVLIDAGGGLGDANLVEEGIGWFEAHAPRSVLPSTVRETILVYNLANGYATRQRLRSSPQASGDAVALSEDPDTKLQKIYYQRVAHAQFLVEPDLRARSLVNYGNLLHELGRFVESADQYEAALNARPRHPAALANSAATLMDIAHLARPTFEAHWVELHHRLRHALRSGHVLVRSAGPRLKNVAEVRLRRIEEELVKHGGLDSVVSRVRGRELAAKKVLRRPPQVLKWWARHGLYLSLNARLKAAPVYWKDEIDVAPLPASQWPLQAPRQQLADRLNEMRSDYSTARYLLVTGCCPTIALSKLARVSPLSMTAAAADWSLPLGLVKAAYRISADILDKAAGYMNLLFGWRIRDRDAYFTRAWYRGSEKRRGLERVVVAVLRRNPYVRGLYDLSLDWQDADLLDRHRQLRHALTHRYVPIYLEAPANGGESVEVLSPEEIRWMALLMLRTARAAIAHVVGATEMEISHHLRADARAPRRSPAHVVVPTAPGDEPPA